MRKAANDTVTSYTEKNFLRSLKAEDRISPKRVSIANLVFSFAFFSLIDYRELFLLDGILIKPTITASQTTVRGAAVNKLHHKCYSRITADNSLVDIYKSRLHLRNPLLYT